MKKRIIPQKIYPFTLTFSAFLMLASCNQAQPDPETLLQPDSLTSGHTITVPVNVGGRIIKVAILLDTSGSMDGLIAQTKVQLWNIVNQLAKARDAEGNPPRIELALYQYGNDGVSVLDGYVQKISGFTSELDDISEELFALTTNGGSEYCGTAINTSLRDLNWSNNPDDLQVIYICGNEEFTQGSIPYNAACQLAKEKHIQVNTIFCGDYQEGVRTNWKHGADLTGGKYLNINHDAQIVHINTPYDVQINQLNIHLNGTYIPYGSTGRMKVEKQKNEDKKAKEVSQATYSSRAVAKSGAGYKNSSWDLVDASEEASFQWSGVAATALPDTMKNMNEAERKAYVESQKEKREGIKAQMAELAKKREAYITAERAKMNIENQLDQAVIESITELAETKEFEFK